MVFRVLQHLTLCHSIIIDQKTGSFSASSPDELAIIKGADELGASFLGKDQDDLVSIRIPSNPSAILKFKILSTLEFSSARKRMSVIVEDLQTG